MAFKSPVVTKQKYKRQTFAVLFNYTMQRISKRSGKIDIYYIKINK